MSLIDKTVNTAIEQAWDRDLARLSMERWLTLCDKNSWTHCPDNLNLLALLFGASWYFTRFVFFRGRKVACIFDGNPRLDFTVSSLLDDFHKRCVGDDETTHLEALRIAKNEIMLGIFLAHLQKTATQEELEQALTVLADATLLCAVDIVLAGNTRVKNAVAILAMGRMASHEMNFGSDLDLIFLYQYGADKFNAEVSSFVRHLTQSLALASPGGMLYEVDMRLRPHGNSGVLVANVLSFVEYHTGQREIWERQMMTRCRVVLDSEEMASSALAKIEPSLYQHYDDETLCREIVSTRQMVVDGLRTQRTKYHLKKSVGGIMDIDFITHYLQLLKGADHKSLQGAGTRQALRLLCEARDIQQADYETLMQAYDYLKTLESHLRVFDMKPVSVFSEDFARIEALARSIGSDGHKTIESLLDHYKETVQAVRKIFTYLMIEKTAQSS